MDDGVSACMQLETMQGTTWIYCLVVVTGSTHVRLPASSRRDQKSDAYYSYVSCSRVHLVRIRLPIASPDASATVLYVQTVRAHDENEQCAYSPVPATVGACICFNV